MPTQHVKEGAMHTEKHALRLAEDKQRVVDGREKKKRVSVQTLMLQLIHKVFFCILVGNK